MPKSFTERSDRCQHEARQRGAELDALREEAGLTEKIAKLERYPSYPGYHIEPGSLEWERNSEAEASYARSSRRRGTRAAYFGVKDVELRKRLIAASRAMDQAADSYFLALRDEAAHAVGRAERKQSYWYLWASALGVAMVLGTADQFGQTEALAASVVAVMFGLKIRDEAEQQRNAEIVRLREEAAEQDKSYRETAGEQPTFHLSEEHTGEPDELMEKLTAERVDG